MLFKVEMVVARLRYFTVLFSL